MAINVMISSTVRDLVRDRKAVGDALLATGLVDLVGADPAQSSGIGTSPYVRTIDMATSCDLYMLILGRRYGYVTESGMSATEAEFDAAYRADPTKVVVLLKCSAQGALIDPEQQTFIDKVCDYHRGYFVSSYSRVGQLKSVTCRAFEDWLVERSAVGRGLDYFDHFVRLASQRSPFPRVRPEIRTTDATIELSYVIAKKVRSIHFDKEHVYRDFWGCLFELEDRFREWREE